MTALRMTAKDEPEFTISHIDENDPNVANFMGLEFREGEPQKMGKFDKLVDMPSFPEIFTYGGDEKLPLDPVKGHNLHFIKPYVDDDAIIRSSCTSSPPT